MTETQQCPSTGCYPTQPCAAIVHYSEIIHIDKVQTICSIYQTVYHDTLNSNAFLRIYLSLYRSVVTKHTTSFSVSNSACDRDHGPCLVLRIKRKFLLQIIKIHF
jgi:hypothetical protein